MVNRFVKVNNELAEVADTDGLQLSVRTDAAFYSRCQREGWNLKEIDWVMKQLQANELPLERCRFLSDTLISAVETQKRTSDTPLYRHSLGKHYINLNSSKSPNYHFESGVTKIQRGDVDDLSDLELAACAHLKVKNVCDDLSLRSFDDERTMSMAKLLRSKKRQKTEISNEYM